MKKLTYIPALLFFAATALTGCGSRTQEPHSVIFVNSQYKIEQGKVMWGQMGEIEGADAQTFVVEDEYGRDKNHVYIANKLLEEADAETFKSLGKGYAIDKDNAFFGARTLHGKSVLEEIDIHTFVLIGGRYAKNKDYVYFMWKLMENADPDTFVSLNDQYMKDKNHVYYEGKQIPNVTPEKFSILGGVYGTDGTHVYAGRIIIQGADAQTFKTKGSYSAEDQYATYDGGRRIEK